MTTQCWFPFIHNWASFLLWPSCFILSGVISDCPPLFISSILDTFWPGGLIFKCHIVLPFHSVHGTVSKNTGVTCCLWTIFCQNSSLLPLCLGWPCIAWLITSLSYSSHFVTTNLWSMKGTQWLKPLLSISSHHYYLQANSHSLIGVFNQHSITLC